jgi:Ca2+-binding EF-hand superfamily protein
MYKKVLSGLFLALIAVPAFASAPAFEKIDSDKDGTISQVEATTAGISKKLFVKFDIDKDTTLSVDEYEALVKSLG